MWLTRLFLPPCTLPPQSSCFLLPPQGQAEEQPQPCWPQHHGQPQAAGEASALPQEEQTSSPQALGKEKATTRNGIPAP